MSDLTQQFLELRKKYLENRFSHLNPVQREAVFTVNGPLLILAGAGSGKTTVLVNRVANLILFGNAYASSKVLHAPTAANIDELQACIQGGAAPSPALAPLLAADAVQPWNVLAITFTNKAADELKNRLGKLLGQAMGQDVHASTFHSACVRILRREAEKLGFPRAFTIYDADDQQRVLKEVYKTLNIDDKFLPVRQAASAIGRLKDRMITPAQAAEAPADYRAKLVAQLYAQYAKRCLAAGALDFDDLIYYTVRLLREFKEVRDYYQARYRYILVDEYQDTSVAQFQLVSLLAGPEANVCVVGDDDQSIYRFRGATIENILSFEHHFPGANIIRLEQNYRSTQSILNAANAVISHNAGRKGKTLWTDNTPGPKVVHYRAADEQDEAAFIADTIGRNVKEGFALKDHAVLYRMNAQSSPVENYFARAGIPYKIIGGLRFNDRKEVKDLHAYMSLVVNPQDDLRLRRIINEPARKIGATTLDAIAGIAAGLGVSMLEVVKEADSYPALSRAQKALKAFWNLYTELAALAQQLSLEEFAARLPEVTGYKAMLEAQGDEGITRLENIGQLVSNVKTYADQNGLQGTLEGYLEEIALISDIDNYDETADRVVLMTLHTAKGLEFPYVFIVGLEEGVFPGEQSRYSEEDVEEERRLCYVGITRAKRGLVIMSAAARMLYGQTRRNHPSRFVEEIGEDLLDQQESPHLGAARLSVFSPFDGTWEEARGGYLDKNYNRRPGRGAGVPAGGGTTIGMAGPGAGQTPLRRGRPNAPAASYGGYTSAGPARQKNTGLSFAEGDRVEHKVFGQGVVKQVTPVAGDTIVEIDFGAKGTKKTMANYAPLKKIDP